MADEIRFKGRTTRQGGGEEGAGQGRRILAELFEDSGKPFGISSPEGRIDYVNGAFERLTGYSCEELRSMERASDLTPPEWLVMERAIREELCRTGTSVTYEKEYIRKDGSRVPVELLIHLKRDESGRPLYYYSFATDITERKRMAERIQHLSYFPQFNPNPIIETDYLGKVTFANPATSRILEGMGIGGDAGLFVPADLDDILRAWDGKSESTLFREISLGTRVFRETIFLTPRYTIVRIYVHDITDIRQAEKSLRENEERLRLFIEHAPAGLAIFDRDMRYLSVSRRWLRDYGLNDRDLTGRCHYEVFPEIGEAWKEAHRRGLAGEALRAEADPFQRADGSVQWLRWEIHPWHDSSGQVGGIVIFSEDITERKRAEEALKSAHDDLEQKVTERTWELAAALNDLRKESSNRIQALEALREQEQLLIHQGRLAAMGEMIGNIAHQWRQPLNTLGLIIQAIPLSLESGEFTRELLDERVDRAMQLIFHMSQTIEDFRNFFRPDKEKVRFDLRGVISNALALVGENFSDLGIEVSFDGPCDIFLDGYPNEFSQAILNILMNARDALEERRVAEPRIMVRMFAEGNRVVVTVADNAGGIAAEIIGKVFDPYFTSKGPNKGTGIGLFIARTIIESNMAGTLTVRNTGEGAEFRVEV